MNKIHYYVEENPHDNLFLILSQLSSTLYHLVSMHQIDSLICNQLDKLMVKMTTLFLQCNNCLLVVGAIVIYTLGAVPLSV